MPILRAHDYRDETDHLLFQVVRHATDNPDDRYRQRRPDGAGGWIWDVKGVRKFLLYRLSALIEAVKAGRRVLVCEGERDADTAVALGCDGTTMPGGVGKWRAEYDEFFRGADVVVVSDRDEQSRDPKTGAPLFHPDGRPKLPGQDHAARVTKRLCKVAARVRLIIFPQKDLTAWREAGGDRAALDALVEAAPDHKPASPEPDNSNVIDLDAHRQRRDAEIERLAALEPLDYEQQLKGTAKALNMRQTALDRAVKAKRPKPDKFAMTDDGLSLRGQWIAQPVEVVALARDPDEALAWSAIVRFRNPDGAICEAPLSKGALINEPNVALSALADRGMNIKTTRIAEPNERLILARRVGWIEGAFLLPDEIIGRQTSERVIWAHGKHRYERRGTLDQWRDIIARPAGDHLMLRFALSTAFAGTLLRLGGFESGMFNLWGFSSVGKTTLLRASATPWGSGEDGGYVQNWRTTDNALETTAESASDTFLPIDELGQAKPDALRRVAYMLTGATAKARMNRDSTAKALHRWRIIALSSSEKPIAELLRDGHNAAHAGQLVRAIDIKADEQAHGAFDHYADFDAKTFADRLKLAASTSCGHAGPEFVRQLIARRPDVRKMVAAFVADALGEINEDQGQAARVAERFGLVVAAGELAIEFGIFPWPAAKPTEDAPHAVYTMEGSARRRRRSRTRTNRRPRQAIARTPRRQPLRQPGTAEKRVGRHA